jgi:hypothetical protein
MTKEISMKKSLRIILVLMALSTPILYASMGWVLFDDEDDATACWNFCMVEYPEEHQSAQFWACIRGCNHGASL